MKQSNGQLVSIKPVILAFLILPFSTMAAGVGFYGSLGYGQGAYWDDDASRPNLATLSFSKTRLGGGLVWDNAVAGRSLFNYRLNLGAEAVEDIIPNPAYNFYGFRLNWLNDFGFALVRAPALRWWLGPQQGVFYLDESDGNGNGISSFDLGFGGVTGLNFNFPRRATLALDLSLRYLWEFASRMKYATPQNINAEYLGDGWECGLTISFLVRGVRR